MSHRRFSLLFSPITLPCLLIAGWLSVSELSGANQDANIEDKPLVIELRDKIELAEIQVAIREQMVNIAEAEATPELAEVRKTEALLNEAKVERDRNIQAAERIKELAKRNAATSSEQDAAVAKVSISNSHIVVLEATLDAQKKPSRVDEERIRLLELKAKKAKIKLAQLHRKLDRFKSSVSGDAVPFP